MILLFNAQRTLTKLAADAVSEGVPMAPADAPLRPWRFWRPGLTSPIRPPPRVDEGSAAELDADDPQRRRLEHAIRVAVAGGPGNLHDVLAPDAVGWSPTFNFSSRDEVEVALQNAMATLVVLEFEVDALFWVPPVAVAEWRLEAMQTSPILVGDDLLVEGGAQPITLCGASIVGFREDRVATIHTYFDEAALIEQVVLHTELPTPRPGR
jgi:hypothetical protein